MLGGNGATLDLILVTLRMLRELGSKLPVEVWHLPGELTPKDERTLNGLGATPRSFDEKGIIVPMKEIKGRQKNFQIKVAAWVNSGFEEIIGLDSDVMPVRDPSYLFETEAYLKHGQIFWPDWWKTHRSTILPSRPSFEHSPQLSPYPPGGMSSLRGLQATSFEFTFMDRC